MANQEVIEYLKESLRQGSSKEDLYKALLSSGWALGDIQEAFESIEGEEEKEDTQKKTIYTVAIIGAILMGAGVFSFIASNWQVMSKPSKVAVILVSMLSFYVVGWLFKEKWGNDKIGNALIFTGTLIYGAGIFLVAQLFHVREDWPDGFILWMFGAIAIGFAIRSFAFFYLAIIVGFVAIVSHPACLFGGLRESDCFLTSSFFLLLTATAVTFIAGWHIRKSIKVGPEDLY